MKLRLPKLPSGCNLNGVVTVRSRSCLRTSVGSAGAGAGVRDEFRRRMMHSTSTSPLVGFMNTARCMSTSSSSSSSSYSTSRIPRTPALSNASRRNLYTHRGMEGVGGVGGRGEIKWRRGFHATSVRMHGGIDRPAPGTGIKVTFKDSKGTVLKTVEANEGDDILSIAHEYDIDLEGACEGSVACSTCHVILDPDSYDLLPEPSDDENDMLDMAFGLTDTSRLGCQIKLTRDLDGITCTLPAATRNMYVDGAKPTHH